MKMRSCIGRLSWFTFDFTARVNDASSLSTMREKVEWHSAWLPVANWGTIVKRWNRWNSLIDGACPDNNNMRRTRTCNRLADSGRLPLLGLTQFSITFSRYKYASMYSSHSLSMQSSTISRAGPLTIDTFKSRVCLLIFRLQWVPRKHICLALLIPHHNNTSWPNGKVLRDSACLCINCPRTRIRCRARHTYVAHAVNLI